MIPTIFDVAAGQDSTLISKGALVNCPAISGLLFADNTLRPSPAGASASIATYTLASGALRPPGFNGNARGMRITVCGFAANNANAKTVFAQLNSVTIWSHVLAISSAENYRMWVDIWFTAGAGSQVHRFSGMGIRGVAPGGVASSLIIGSAAGLTLDATGVLSLVTGVNQTSAADVTQEYVTVEVF